MMRADGKQPNERVHVDPSTGEVINIDRAWQASDRRIAVSRREQALLAAAGMDGPEARWYVLSVKRGFDIPVDNALREARVERWMAAQEVDGKHHGGRRGPKPPPRIVPFLPGYIFVRVVSCAPCWAGLFGVNGVVGVLGGADRPAPVRDDNLLKLRAFTEHDPSAIRILTRALAKGDKVRVDSGPFASFPGVVEDVYDSGRALVEVMIFGRAVPVALDLAQVTKSD